MSETMTFVDHKKSNRYSQYKYIHVCSQTKLPPCKFTYPNAINSLAIRQHEFRLEVD